MPGDQIVADRGSTVIKDSYVNNSFNRFGAEASPETEAALSNVLKAIEKSGNSRRNLFLSTRG